MKTQSFINILLNIVRSDEGSTQGGGSIGVVFEVGKWIVGIGIEGD